MREEFHGDGAGGYKILYNWNSVNCNIWLPSLSELVGTTGTANPNSGCSYSAMQGMNTTNIHYTDANGGAQFAWFKQFNTAGGGAKIWNCGGSHAFWLRSPDLGRTITAWKTTSAQQFEWGLATDSRAVLVGTSSISFTMVIKGITIAYSLHCPSSPQKGTFGSPDQL